MTARQERLRELIRQNHHRRWREKRISERKDPDVTIQGLFREMFLWDLPKLTATLNRYSIVRAK